jgi:hypothetical protein
MATANRKFFLLTALLASWMTLLAGCQDHHHTDGAGENAAGHHTMSTTQEKGRTALLPPEGAAVKILIPAKDQVFTSDQIPLEFQLVKGKRGEHVHAYVDGELMGMFESAKGTLTGISPGKHTLELRVVAADHTSEIDATDRVEFSVK